MPAVGNMMTVAAMIEDPQEESQWKSRPTVAEMNRYTATAVAMLTTHLNRIEALGDGTDGPELREEVRLLVEVTESSERATMGVVSELTRLSGLGFALVGRLADRTPLQVLQSVAQVSLRYGDGMFEVEGATPSRER
jgi:hypothetical protein